MTLQHTFKVSVAIGTLVASFLAGTSAAYADTIRTPINSAVTVQGSSSGNQSSQCGYISNSPNHQLIITEPLVSLRFTLEGGGEPTILIQNAQGRNQCVMSDQFSAGTIELPGAWEEGRYDVFIGDRRGNSHRYTLSISQER